MYPNMLGHTAKLLPPSFFSSSSVDDNNNSNDDGLTDSGTDSDDDYAWVPLGFGSTIADPNVADETAHATTILKPIPLRHGVSIEDVPDPYHLANASDPEISSDSRLSSVRQLLVETGRKRRSPYPPLIAANHPNRTTPKIGEKYVRLSTAIDPPSLLYTPMRIATDFESDEEAADSYAVLHSRRLTNSRSSLVGVVSSAAPHVPSASAAKVCTAQLDASAPATPSRVDVDIRISKQLSWVLRHGAHRVGLKVDEDGYLDVESILKVPFGLNFRACWNSFTKIFLLSAMELPGRI